MKPFVLIILFLTVNIRVFSQVNYSENLWLGVLINGNLSKSFNYSSDVGFRTYDNFVHQKRTFLARIIIEKTFSKNHTLGLGYAFFDHFSQNSSLNLEQRPFLQYRIKIKKNKLDFQTRIRNEFRFYTSRNEFYNRARIQLQVKYNLFEGRFNPVLGEETFFSSGEKSFKENRLTFGFTSKFSQKVTGFFFYTLHKQSNYQGNQHILGLQLQINLSEKNSTK